MRVTGWLPEQRAPGSGRGAPASGRRQEYAWLALWLTCAAILLVIPGWPAILADLGVIGGAMAACWLVHSGKRRRSTAAIAAARASQDVEEGR